MFAFNLLQIIFRFRETMPIDDDELLTTENFCKFEFWIILLAHVLIILFGCFFIQVFAFLDLTAYHLPLDCFIFFLPPGELWLAWEINFLFIFVTMLPMTIFFACYVSVPLLLMNHLCWLLDMAAMAADRMNDILQSDEDIPDLERDTHIDESMRKLVERCERITEWQQQAQDLLQWNFNLEFQVQSLILCFSIYVSSFVSSVVLIILTMIVVCTLQLYAYCWMGSRVTSKMENLSFEVSKNWYLIKPKQRKVCLMLLHWTQAMEGFRGFFHDVNVETFRGVGQLRNKKK